MSDLISRQAVLDKLKDFSDMYTLNEEAKVVLETIVRIVTEQPTAYDVEKVVAELKKESYQEYCDSERIVELKDAIDIVRKGGVE